GCEFLRRLVQGTGRAPVDTDPEDGTMGPGRPGGAELDPSDGAGQLVAELLDCRAVGLLELVSDLLVGVAALRPAGPVDRYADRGLSGLDRRVIAVAKHLHPADGAFRKNRPQL